MTQQTNLKRRFLRLRSAARAAGRTYDRTVSWPALEVVKLNYYGFISAQQSPRRHVVVAAKQKPRASRGAGNKRLEEVGRW